MKVGVLATTAFAFLIGFPIASFAGLAPDADSDGIPDVLDKCMLDSRNTLGPPNRTCDTDSDGYGNVCDSDFDQDGQTLPADFSSHFIVAFKSGVPAPTGTDMDCDGSMLPADFSSFFIPRFKAGSPPGPSGLSCAGTPGCS